MKKYYIIPSFITRIKSSCLISQRKRWVFRFFGLSRVSLKEAIAEGLVFGISRSSW